MQRKLLNILKGEQSPFNFVEEISMLNNKAFDLWADGYDKTVGISDEKNTYPFAGYKKVLGFIFQTIMKTENAIFWILGSGQLH